jgi:hypothetical protein
MGALTEPISATTFDASGLAARTFARRAFEAVIWGMPAVNDTQGRPLEGDATRSSRSSLTPEIRTNSDDSVDVYFAPRAPVGTESNWIPTRPNERFEVAFRFYGPAAPVFDKTWRLPGIEKVL